MRESRTEQQRAAMRAEFETNWPALVAYIKQTDAHGEKMRDDVLCALGEGQGGPSIEKIVWYMLDRAGLIRQLQSLGPPTKQIMNFVGATRKQVRKDINDDAFVTFDGTFAFLMDGAGDAGGAAQKCIDKIKSYQPQMPSFDQLITMLNITLVDFGAESTFVGIKVENNLLSGVSCGDSLLYLIRDGQLLRVNKNTKPRLGTSRPGIYQIALSLKGHDVIIVASDGFVLYGDKLVEMVDRHISKPEELPHALLDAHSDCSDDVTVITRVI